MDPLCAIDVVWANSGLLDYFESDRITNVTTSVGTYIWLELLVHPSVEIGKHLAQNRTVFYSRNTNPLITQCVVKVKGIWSKLDVGYGSTTIKAIQDRI